MYHVTYMRKVRLKIMSNSKQDVSVSNLEPKYVLRVQNLKKYSK